MRLAKTEEGKIDLAINLTIGIWIVLSITAGLIVMIHLWQEQSQKESDYWALGWKTVQADVTDLGNINGDFKPISQTANLQYRYNSEEQITTQQQIGLGYHVGDNVSLFANKNGEVVIKNVPNGSRIPYDPTIKSFGGDYLGCIVAGIFASIFAALGLLVGGVILVLIFAGIVMLYEAIFKSNKKPQTAS